MLGYLSLSKHKFNMILMAIYAGFLLFSYSRDNIITSFISLLLMSIMLINDKRCIISLLITSSFVNIITLNFAGVIVPITRFISIIVLCFFLMIKKWNMHKSELIFVLLLFLSCILSLISENISIIDLVPWILNIVVFAFFTLGKDFLSDIEKQLDYCSIFFIIYLLFVVIQLILFPVTDNIYINRYTIASDVNYNVLAKTVLLSCMMVILRLIKYCRMIALIGVIIALCLGVYSIYITGSRTCLIALFLMLSCVIYMETKNKIALIFLGLPIILTVLLNISASLLVDTRFTIEAVMSDNASGRFSSYPVLLLNVLPEYLFTGVGIGGQYEVLKVMGYTGVSPAHNFVISSILELGILVGPLFLLYVGRSFLFSLQIKKYNKDLSYVAILFSTILLVGLGETVYSERYTFVILGIVTYYKNLYAEIKNQTKN